MVDWAGSGVAVVDCTGPGRPVVGRMETGVLHSTAMTAGVPFVRWQAVGTGGRLVRQRPTDARVVGAEHRRGIVFHPTWLCRDIRSRSGPERAGLKGAGVQPQCRLKMLSCI